MILILLESISPAAIIVGRVHQAQPVRPHNIVVNYFHMKIGLFTDGLAHLGFTEALAKAAGMGVQAIEIGTGNFSPAPHCDLDGLLSSSSARDEFLVAIHSR